MSIEKVKEYFRTKNFEDRIIEFDVSSATVELAAEALNFEPALIANTLSFTVNDGAVLIVEDTGIGIPYEYQDRVFERFFRVDKSHSNQIKGTGLGLSIVKNAVVHLGGTIELESSEGSGTRITVHFAD